MKDASYDLLESLRALEASLDWNSRAPGAPLGIKEHPAKTQLLTGWMADRRLPVQRFIGEDLARRTTG